MNAGTVRTSARETATTMTDEFTNTPPDDATLVPVAAFKAFHNNFTGVPRTGEMKLTFTIPTDDIHDALDVAGARDEILWVQVSKIKFTGVAIQQLADTIAEQEREREKLGLNAAKKKKRASDGDGDAELPSELDWET